MSRPDPIKIVFKLGCLFLVIEIVLISSLLIFNQELFKKLVTLFGAGLIGGRIASISTGLELGFHPFILILLLFIFNLIWLTVFYPLTTSLYLNLVEIKFWGYMLNSTKKMAEIQKSKVMKFGLLGLFLFVWLPLPWTGSLIGAIVGFLIGLSTEKIMSVVIPAMLLGIISWTTGFQYFFILTETTGKYFSTYVVIFILIISLFSRFYWHYKIQK